jgi:hypothetical protein
MAWELDAIIRQRGRPEMIVSDNTRMISVVDPAFSQPILQKVFGSRRTLY